jgi:hypothetical protein
VGTVRRVWVVGLRSKPLNYRSRHHSRSRQTFNSLEGLFSCHRLGVTPQALCHSPGKSVKSLIRTRENSSNFPLLSPQAPLHCQIKLDFLDTYPCHESWDGAKASCLLVCLLCDRTGREIKSFSLQLGFSLPFDVER